MALTDKNHQLIRKHFSGRTLADLTAIDATCGNGYDTVFLAQLGFKLVYAFDIQEQAINKTKQLIDIQLLKNVSLINAGHETIASKISNKVDCVMFNLGYLPSADKNITTNQETTLTAMEQCLNLLSIGGIVSMLCYPGHPQGAIETKAIQDKLELLDKKFKVTEVVASHPGPKAPILYLIIKL